MNEPFSIFRARRKRKRTAAVRANEIRHRRKRHAMGLRKIDKEQREKILARDGYICLKCGETNQEKLTMDHIDVNAEGDKNRDDNVQTLCQLCNVTKAQATTDYRPKDSSK